ncbi:response regulator receiver domain protein [Anaerofustis stercorihominis DSM 17244]|uniref:Stage 0 sporulation protein A homolog n=1 Tax=Anaerofustis stercorihominis DSM 17244 TaxID=445971 RepID=B1C8X4_9FIRM|nr:response regulator transcription factor [Anaerofustis stercorihominis]EDS72034.1 response regulator receiver domain protein [Anaerofustis stercorihominis DSM 17244]
MSRILVVEDDNKLRGELTLYLKNNGYEVSEILDFKHSVDIILAGNADLILLDITLPGIDGEYICKEVRKSSDIPIIMLTSRNNEMDELLSINYGADDYVTKPYNPRILIARIEALLKRVNKNFSDVIFYNGLKLNISKSTFSYNDKEIDLSKNELKILHFLLKNKSRIVSRDELMDYLWDNNEFVDDNTLTVNINRLRKKLESVELKNFIETKRGQGYIIS